MDARFAEIYGLSAPALFCDPSNAGLLGTDGLGYYANQIPQLHPDRVTAPATAVAAGPGHPTRVRLPAA